MTLEVRPVGPDELPDWIAIRNAVTPDWSTGPEEVAWADRTYPGGRRLLAWLDDRPIGAGNAGRIYMFPPDYPSWWAEITVLPVARRQGAGTALLRELSTAAREAGKQDLQVPVSDARPEGRAFLERHGFAPFERSKSLALDLATIQPDGPAVDPPTGIEIVSLAERPELLPGVHAVAIDAFPDIPGEPMAVGGLDEFRSRDVERPGIPLDGFFVALAAEEVIGYASLLVEPARPTVAFHDMTAVGRAWRGRGVAGALKRASIAWAKANGLETLETGNDEANASMRSVNARLGYRPLPDLVFYRGPLLEPAAP